MKSGPRFLVPTVLFVAFLCSTPSALSQSRVNAKVSGGIFRSQTATSVVALAFGPGGTDWDRDHRGGCGDRDRRRGGEACSHVPEGGTSFEYLALASLCGLAAVIFKFGRRTRLPETN